MKALFVLLAMTTTAFAGDITVNDGDQKNIQTICDIAAQSGALNREQRAQVAAYCVGWEKRVVDANKPVEAPPVKEKK
jgi:hypothetical protein